MSSNSGVYSKGSIRAFIALSCSGLSVGESTRDVMCPFCNGGKTKEKAFKITRRAEGYSYKCFRASCGEGGTIDSAGSLIVSEEKEKQLSGKGRPYTGAFETLSDEEVHYLTLMFGIVKSEAIYAGIRWSPFLKKYALPVRGPYYDLRGWNLRAFRPEQDSKLKWDAYPDRTDLPWMSWYIRSSVRHTPIVVVEDQISALKVSRQYPSVALLGTRLDLQMLDELLEQERISGAGIIIALDGDAYNKSLSIIDRFKFYLDKKARVVKLGQDLKWLSDSQIKNYIEEVLAL